MERGGRTKVTRREKESGNEESDKKCNAHDDNDDNDEGGG